MVREIYIHGFPKSGNTWLSRLLGDVLDSPVRAVKGTSLADEGYNRQGGYVIRQQHLIIPEDAFGLIYIYRDPRDVCVSANHYWQMGSLKKAQRRVAKGLWPTTHLGGWVQFHKPWRDIVKNGSKVKGVIVTNYETLHVQTAVEILRICIELGAEPVSLIGDVVKRQSFYAKQYDIMENPDNYDHAFGQTIQLRNLRKGVVGDWINHYTREIGKEAQTYFGDDMLRLGYIQDSLWWEGLPE